MPSSRRTTHLSSFREELPFEVWFTRILINGCLDRIKARTRRERWLVSSAGAGARRSRISRTGWPAAARRPRSRCSLASGARSWPAALSRLPDRQRSVFMLSHYEGCTSREVSAMTGLNESTVRVHLFRAIRRLRTLLTDDGSAAAADDHRRQTSCPYLMLWGAAASGRHRVQRAVVRGRGRRRRRGRRIRRRTSGELRRLPRPLRRLRRLARRRPRRRHRREPTRPSPPSVWPRSSRRSSAASKRSSARPGSSPSRSTPGRSAATRSGPQRWIAAAAAAGLIVGLGAGELLDLAALRRACAAADRDTEPLAPERRAAASSRSRPQLGRRAALRRGPVARASKRSRRSTR